MLWFREYAVTVRRERRRRSEDLFAEARRAPALAALLGLRSEDLFVEGPPGARERAGRPSPISADLVRICCQQHFSSK